MRVEEYDQTLTKNKRPEKKNQIIWNKRYKIACGNYKSIVSRRNGYVSFNFISKSIICFVDPGRHNSIWG